VLAVSQKKVEKRRGGVKRIGQYQIEGTRIRADTRTSKRSAVATSSSPAR
jgi:hypothetical protein